MYCIIFAYNSIIIYILIKSAGFLMQGMDVDQKFEGVKKGILANDNKSKE